MIIVCEHCNLTSSSLQEWYSHLVTKAHQASASVQISLWSMGKISAWGFNPVSPSSSVDKCVFYVISPSRDTGIKAIQPVETLSLIGNFGVVHNFYVNLTCTKALAKVELSPTAYVLDDFKNTSVVIKQVEQRGIMAELCFGLDENGKLPLPPENSSSTKTVPPRHSSTRDDQPDRQCSVTPTQCLVDSQPELKSPVTVASFSSSGPPTGQPPFPTLYTESVGQVAVKETTSDLKCNVSTKNNSTLTGVGIDHSSVDNNKLPPGKLNSIGGDQQCEQQPTATAARCPAAEAPGSRSASPIVGSTGMSSSSVGPPTGPPPFPSLHPAEQVVNETTDSAVNEKVGLVSKPKVVPSSVMNVTLPGVSTVSSSKPAKADTAKPKREQTGNLLETTPTTSKPGVATAKSVASTKKVTSDHVVATVPDVLAMFFKDVILSQKEIDWRKYILKTLTDIIRSESEFQSCMLTEYGSFSTKLGDSGADLNLTLTGYDNVKIPMPPTTTSSKLSVESYVSKKVCDLLRTSGAYKTIELQQRFPKRESRLLNFIHERTEISCRVTFKNLHGLRTSELIKILTKFDPRVYNLMLLVRYWGKVYNVTGPKKLTNYTLSLLVVVFLARKKILPTIHQLQGAAPVQEVNGWNCGFCVSYKTIRELIDDSRTEEEAKHDQTVTLLQLLRDFFVMMTKEEFNTRILCTLTAESVPLKVFRAKVPTTPFKILNLLPQPPIKYNFAQHYCNIQDPFDLENNLGFPLYPQRLEKMKKYFKGSAEHLSVLLNRYPEKDLTMVQLFPNEHVPANASEVVEKKLTLTEKNASDTTCKGYKAPPASAAVSSSAPVVTLAHTKTKAIVASVPQPVAAKDDDSGSVVDEPVVPAIVRTEMKAVSTVTVEDTAATVHITDSGTAPQLNQVLMADSTALLLVSRVESPPTINTTDAMATVDPTDSVVAVATDTDLPGNIASTLNKIEAKILNLNSTISQEGFQTLKTQIAQQYHPLEFHLLTEFSDAFFSYDKKQGNTPGPEREKAMFQLWSDFAAYFNSDVWNRCFFLRKDELGLVNDLTWADTSQPSLYCCWSKLQGQMFLIDKPPPKDPIKKDKNPLDTWRQTMSSYRIKSARDTFQFHCLYVVEMTEEMGPSLKLILTGAQAEGKTKTEVDSQIGFIYDAIDWIFQTVMQFRLEEWIQDSESWDEL